MNIDKYRTERALMDIGADYECKDTNNGFVCDFYRFPNQRRKDSLGVWKGTGEAILHFPVESRGGMKMEKVAKRLEDDCESDPNIYTEWRVEGIPGSKNEGLSGHWYCEELSPETTPRDLIVKTDQFGL